MQSKQKKLKHFNMGFFKFSSQYNLAELLFIFRYYSALNIIWLIF